MSDPAGSSVPRAGSDAALLLLVRTGDTSAADELRARHAAAARLLAALLTSQGDQVAAARHIDDRVQDITAESWHLMLTALRGGGGPSDAFRPHLLAIVAKTAQLRAAGQPSWTTRPGKAGQVPAADVPGPGHSFAGPAAAGPDTAAIVRAYLTLPESWAAVLWHSEVELAPPSQVALLLGLTVREAAGLVRYARAALRTAYLRIHLGELPDPACRQAVRDLADVTPGWRWRHWYAAARHLRGCARCQGGRRDITDLSTSLRTTLAPLVLGEAAAAYCAMTAGPAGGPKASAPHRPGKRASSGRVLAGAVSLAAVVMTGGWLALRGAAGGPDIGDAAGGPSVAPATAPPVAAPAYPVPRKENRAQPSPSGQPDQVQRHHPAAHSHAPQPAPTPAPTHAPRPAPAPSTRQPEPSRSPNPSGAACRTTATADISADCYTGNQGSISVTAATGDSTPSGVDGKQVAQLVNGDYLEYPDVNFGSGSDQFDARVASGVGYGVSGLVEVVLDNPSKAPIGSFAVASTGGWSSWKTIPANIDKTAGVHTVYLEFASGATGSPPYASLHYFSFPSA
jgi:hypothetical protein